MGSRGWCFTLNNPKKQLKPEEWKEIKYCIWQQEQGENGTVHYQGYVLFNKPQRLAAVKGMVKRAHWEPRRGTHEQARDYASKAETRMDGPWTIGKEPKAGRRVDLESVKADIDAGKTEVEIADDHFEAWCKYERSFRRYKQLKEASRQGRTCLYLVWGPPGTGKTRGVRDAFPDLYPYDPDCPWERYDGHDTVLLDEFSSGHIKFGQLLKLCDFGELILNCKYGSVNFVAKRVFIISNIHPAEWYRGVPNIAALWRRVDGIAHFTGQMTGVIEDYNPEGTPEEWFNGDFSYFE